MQAVGLPDVDAFASLPDDVWRGLGRRLREIGLQDEVVSSHWVKALLGGDPRKSPLVKWKLRRSQDLVARAMRMFVFADPVDPAEAQSVLGDQIRLDGVLRAGLLRHEPDGGVASPFLLKSLGVKWDSTSDGGALFILSDDLYAGGAAVMGPSQATVELAGIAAPRARMRRALDVGCGAGTLAMVLAHSCETVIATDVSPRALTVTRVNALLNGIDNIELRLGDLFEPVAGESFDTILSQPPFVPRPDGASETPFLFGGGRGDELPLRLLGGVGAHLVPGGRGWLLVEWPMVEGDLPLEMRLREAMGPASDLSLLIIPTSSCDVDLHCVAYGKVQNEGLAGDVDRAVIAHREHLERQKIRSLLNAYTLVHRETESRGWTATITPPEIATPLTRDALEALVAAKSRGEHHPATPGPSPSSLAVEQVMMHSAIPLAENMSLVGRPEQAINVYRKVLERAPTSREAVLGVARLEIRGGTVDGWPEKLLPMVELGDREARRLLGDVHWNRGEIDAALGCYAVHRRMPVSVPSSFAQCAVDNNVRFARRTNARRRFLVWITCASFARSALGQWFDPGRPRLWDLAVNFFQPTDEPLADHVEHVILGGQSKLSCVKAALCADRKLFDGYQTVLLLDDDIGMRHEDVDRFFWSMARHQIELAHPSFSDDSTGGSRAIFQQREASVRFTNSVDLRAPAFSSTALATCVDSFDQSLSGGGLPQVWSHLLRDQRHAIGVVDAVVARHTRPVDPINGPFYRHLRAIGVDPDQETFKVYAQYGCAYFRPRTLGDVDAHGHERHYPD